MPITYSIDTERRLTLETWRGVVDTSQLAEHWTRLLADEKALAIRRTICDISDCRIRISSEELWSLINWIVLPRLAGRKWVTAIVVGKPSSRSLTWHYGAFADTFSIDQTFVDYLAAREWILRQEPDPAGSAVASPTTGPAQSLARLES